MIQYFGPAIAFYAVDRLAARLFGGPAARGLGGGPDSLRVEIPLVPLEEAAKITRPSEGGAIALIPSAAGAILGHLAMRSAVEVQMVGVDARLGMRAWAMVPLQAGVPVAATVAEQAVRQGLATAVSLSVVWGMCGKDVPAVLIIGPPAMVRPHAHPRGQVAILLRPHPPLPSSDVAVVPPPAASPPPTSPPPPQDPRPAPAPQGEPAASTPADSPPPERAPEPEPAVGPPSPSPPRRAVRKGGGRPRASGGKNGALNGARKEDDVVPSDS